jgi:hypothetical protein
VKIVPSSSACSRRASSLALALLAGFAALALGVAAKAASNPFEALKGDWKGGGTVWLTSGKVKDVDCTATYKVSGSNLTQTLECTGDDYEIEATLKLSDKDGKVKGRWQEVIYDASGAVSGNAKPDVIRAVIRGDKFSGRLSLKTTETGHTINIVQLNEKTGTYRLASSLSFQRE